eukprot:gene4285-4591_t
MPLQCQWGHVQPEDELGPFSIDYYYLYYCLFQTGSTTDQNQVTSESSWFSIRNFIILPFILCWIIWLIHLLAQTAANYFSPTLATISHKLKISHDLAGVTLLALGNGAPDVFSIIASFKKSSEDPAVGVGAIVGASLFSSAIVIGSIAILCPCEISPLVYLRDCSFHIIAALAIGWFHIVGEVTVGMSLILFLIYMIYIGVVLSSSYFNCYVKYDDYGAISDDEHDHHHCHEHHYKLIEQGEHDHHHFHTACNNDHDQGHAIDCTCDSKHHKLVEEVEQKQQRSRTTCNHDHDHGHAIDCTCHSNQYQIKEEVHHTQRHSRTTCNHDHDHGHAIDCTCHSEQVFQHHDHHHHHEHDRSRSHSPFAGHSPRIIQDNYDHELVLQLIANPDNDSSDDLNLEIYYEDPERHPLAIQNPTSIAQLDQYGTFSNTATHNHHRLSPRPLTPPSCAQKHHPSHLHHSHPHTCNHPSHHLHEQEHKEKKPPCLICLEGKADHDHMHQHELEEEKEKQREREEQEELNSSIDCYTMIYHYTATLLESLDWRKFALQRRFHHQLIAKEWKTYSRLYQYYYLYLEFPITILRDLTIPSLEEEEESLGEGGEEVKKLSWNQIYAILHPILDLLLLVYISTKFEGDEKWLGMSPLVFCFVIGGCMSLFIALTTKRSEAPSSFIFQCIWTIMAFVMCIVWISFFADELVVCLTALGNILEIPSGLLGITILAWGNGIGDYCTNLAIAKQGYGAMAIAGSNAGPIFNILIGFGISLFYSTSIQYPEPYYFHIHESLLLSIYSLIGILGLSFIIVLCRKFQFDSIFGMMLIGYYIIYSFIQLIFVLLGGKM